MTHHFTVIKPDNKQRTIIIVRCTHDDPSDPFNGNQTK